MEAPSLLNVRDLKMHFPARAGAFGGPKRMVRAVDGLTFDIARGETLGLVGESGCGKTTAGRAILQLTRPTAGAVVFKGQDLTDVDAGTLRAARRHMQMIFQDPYASLNPRMTIGEAIARPLRIHGLARGVREERAAVAALMEKVGLTPSWRDRYPHEFSGGQRQRVGIARALATAPDFIVCDEPISALDVSIQAQVVTLLERLRDDLGLTYLFIAHDLSMVRYISTRVGVMYLGRLVELSDSETLYRAPLHPYTRALLSAVPIPDPVLERKRARILLTGEIPSAADPPAGCHFHTRCPLAQPQCRQIEPQYREVAAGHFVACHLV